MTENFQLAERIYDKLKSKGAGIGNASIFIIESVLDESKTTSNERVFTLNEALEIFEAGANWYEDNEDFIRFRITKPVDKTQYFKEKFGIEITDTGK